MQLASECCAFRECLLAYPLTSMPLRQRHNASPPKAAHRIEPGICTTPPALGLPLNKVSSLSTAARELTSVLTFMPPKSRKILRPIQASAAATDLSKKRSLASTYQEQTTSVGGRPLKESDEEYFAIRASVQQHKSNADVNKHVRFFVRFFDSPHGQFYTTT